MSDLLARITINPDILHGRPCIRGLRISVADVLGQFAAGASRQDILRDYPYLEDADLDAVLAFAARLHECGERQVRARSPACCLLMRSRLLLKAERRV